MNKHNMTKTEKAYKRFDIISKIVLNGILALSGFFGVLFLFAKTEDAKALFGMLMSVGILPIFFIAPKIGKKRERYIALLYNEKNAVVRIGIFKEIYDAYLNDGFEFNLVYDKLLFQEYYSNTIDIGFVKYGHVFLIAIDENIISIIADKETDCPIEKEIPLTDIETMDVLYKTINDYIKEFA